MIGMQQIGFSDAVVDGELSEGWCIVALWRQKKG